MAKRIPLEEVTSSNILALGYDVEAQLLAVMFKSGDTWHYAGVPYETAEALHDAPSIGSYYSSNIRGKFTAEKMTGSCPRCGDKGWIGDTCGQCQKADYATEERTHDDTGRLRDTRGPGAPAKTGRGPAKAPAAKPAAPRRGTGRSTKTRR